MFTDRWTNSFGKAGRDSFGITLLRPGWLSTGIFVLKFSPSGFETLLTRSSLRLSNAPWELFLVRNENEGDVVVSFCLYRHGRTAPWLQHWPSYDLIPGCYLHGPGTGMTNLPSFSAMKFSLVLVELPLASFFSTLMMSFFVGLSVRQTLPPVGESIGVAAFFASSGVRSTSSMLDIFSPASPDCIIL